MIRPPAQLPSPARSAFTLIELLIVMFLITLVMGIIAPSFKGFAVGTRDKEPVGNILALMSYARTQAISEARNYRLQLNAANNTYSLTAQTGSSYEPLSTEWSREFSLPDGMIVNLTRPGQGETFEDASAIVFYPTGRAEVAAVTITNRAGEQTQIGIQSPTETPRILSQPKGATK